MTRRKTILFVHGADEWYGSDVVLFDIVSALRETEFDARVIVPDDLKSELPPEVRLSGRLRAAEIPVYSVPIAVLRRRYMNPAGIAGVVARARRAKGTVLSAIGGARIDLVHSHTSTVLSGAAVARALGVPHVWHVSEVVQRPWIVRHALASFIARRADRVAAVSESVSEHLASTVPELRSRTEVIYNAVDIERLGRVAAARAYGPRTVIGLIGRVGTMKGQEVLLNAAPTILKRAPESRIVFMGGPLNGRAQDFRALTSAAAALGFGERIRVVDFQRDIAGALAGIDILVQPSVRPESFGMTAVEAMATAIPVVASAHGGANETVVHNETGFLVPVGNAQALAESVVKLATDSSLRYRMGTAGRARAASLFSLQTFSERYLAMYRALLANSRQAE